MTAINGKTIDDTAHASCRSSATCLPDKSAQFSLIRDGATLTKTVTIDPRPKEADLKALKLWPGFVVTPVTPEIRDELDLAPSIEGLVVARIEEKSTADIAGLKQGDVIKAIGSTTVKTVGEFYKALNAQAGEVKLSFVREGVELSIGITR